MTDPLAFQPVTWRQAHLGHWLRLALERFDARVMALMARHTAVPLGLANLVAREQVGAAHIHITRHLPQEGARLTELAQRAGMRGIQEWLSFYYKAPMAKEGLQPEHNLFTQEMKLYNTLRYMMGEDQITHLGIEYYQE